MIRDDLKRALEMLGDRLPDRRVVLLVRRAFGDRAVTFLRGDVESVTGHPATAFETPTEAWSEIVHPDDRDRVVERLGRLPDVDELRLEYRVVEPSGGIRWIRESLRVQRSGPETPPAVVGLLTDVTFERTVQARVSRLVEELWRSRRLESLGTMATSVAHDFNNLLTVILAASDLLRHDTDLPDDSAEDVRVIREAALRGSTLVEQILTFAARRPREAESVRPADLVTELEGILQRAVGNQVRLSVAVDEASGPVKVDPAHMEQILFNLATNARDAMSSAGSLRVTVDDEVVEEPRPVQQGRLRPGRYVRIMVEDDGPGMDQDVLNRVFEPFFTTKSGTRGSGGGGFGLPTVLRLVRGYGGAIDVRSEPGRGSCFRVYLPVREEEGAGMLDATVRGEIDPPSPGKARILVVEDDPAVRDAVRDVLERHGHAVAVAGSAREGLELFDRVRPPFDLLLADVVLPDRSGHDLWRAASRRVGVLPVIFMSGYDRQTIAREGVTDPHLLILEKPVAPDELLEAVERALAENGGDRPDGLSRAGEAGS